MMTVRPRVQLSVLAMSALLLTSFLLHTPTAAASPDILNQVIVLTNEHRRAAGCANLEWNPALATAAQRHADDMAANNYFSHTSRNGAGFAARIKAADYHYRMLRRTLPPGSDHPRKSSPGG